MKLFEPEIIYVTKSEYKDGWGFKEHQHDYYQIICVMNGSCTVEIEGVNRKIGIGQSALISKNASHALLTEKNERALVVDIKFVLHGEDKELEDCLGFIDTSDEEFMRGMDFIANEAVKNKPMFKELIELRFNELLLLILRNKRIHEQEGSNDYYSLELSGIAVEIAKYLEENYDKFIKLEDIAKTLGYSKIYLCQCFKKQAGIGIFTYLYDIRLRHAKKLLMDTEMPHEQIIAKTGFKTVNHFSRCFKQVYGISPGKMRRKMKKIIDVPVLLSSEYEEDLKTDNRVIVSQ